MAALKIHSFEEYKAYEGKELGTSDYLKITQEQIDKFADATLDHQWIHTDQEKAKKESPFKNTIAHGYLTLSVLPYLWGQVVEVKNNKMMVNYGIDNLKFITPVLVDSELRLKASLKITGEFKRYFQSGFRHLDRDKGAKKTGAAGRNHLSLPFCQLRIFPFSKRLYSKTSKPFKFLTSVLRVAGQNLTIWKCWFLDNLLTV